MKAPSLAELQRKVDDWNARYPIGTPVHVRRDRGCYDTTTRSHAQVLSNHSAVVWLASISGCYALDRVTPRVAEAAP